MKNKSILILSLALLFLFAQACQYYYPMIAPPKAGQYDGDSLEDEDAGNSGIKGNLYFVSVSGDGDMDGSSWENAIDLEGLRVLLTDNTDLSDVTVCLAEGKYIIGREAGAGLNLTKNIKSVVGGFSASSAGTEVTTRDIKQYKTIFSGDVNGDSMPDDGDCCMFIVSGGASRFDGITFECGYIDDNLSAINEQGAGPVFGIKGPTSTTCVEAVDCIFQNNLSNASGNSGSVAGGTCAVVSKGYFKAKNCQFLGNKCKSRGGAVRLMNDNAVAFFDKCYFSGNQLMDSGSAWGTCIQVTGGCCLTNNCTMAGNKGIGGDINGGGAFLVVNTTVINNASDTFGAFRCESKANTNTHFMNNALLSEKDNGVGFVYQGTNHDITSSGFNLLAGYTGTDIKKPTDVVYGTKIEGEITDGCFVWDQTKISSITTFAKVADVIATVRAFNPTCNKEVTSVGEAYYSWVGESGFATDQLGNTRNPEKMQRGSYDATLE